MIPETIKTLIRRFHENIEALKASDNETQIRIEYLNPFFKELGWDVENRTAEGIYREVSHEYTIRDEIGRAKKADYCFQLGKIPMFFVEAKTPSVLLDKDPKPAYQLRKYGWNAKVPLGILTDFEEFAIYDCRYEPKITDKANQARVTYLTYQDYETKWHEIVTLFSRDAVANGSLDGYVRGLKVKRGILEVDEAFLKEMEAWREMLAADIAFRNPALTQREINFAVQRTIDRIIFLRICEDREIEPYGTLRKLQKKKGIYPHLVSLYDYADKRYNSGLFYFKAEKNRLEDPDGFTQALVIDDAPLKKMIERLYYPAPYAFSIMPADILGQIYERFLGKVIRLDSARNILVEEKPEVRKAGGVYYTPTYIVDYIVRQTVGKLIEGKSPKAIEKLKVLDPACGSGSFLINAYQFLLDWHLIWYKENHPEKHAKGKKAVLMRDANGEWKLTIDMRKRILLNHIFGVDIDSQAVEVTKLSLLLKVLEGEDAQTVQRQLGLFKERALPDLGKNIKCGNSLIGSDFYDNQQMALDEEAIYRVNVFDWDLEFPEIMKRGGFDAVIGNPPYGAFFSNEESNFLSKKYNSFEYQLNSFVIFMEKGGNLLNQNGKISFITPAVFLAQHYFKEIRKVILKNYSIENIVILNYKVFKSADIGDTCIFVFNNKRLSDNILKFSIIRKKELFNNMVFEKKNQSDLLENPRHEIYLSENKDLSSKLENHSISLGELANCIMGIKPYQKGKGHPKQVEDVVKKRIYDSPSEIDESYKQYLIGKDIDRYVINPLENRYIKYGEWLAEPRFTAPFEKDKIILRQTSDKIRAVIDKEKYYNLNNIYNIELKNTDYHYNYILGIINSKLMVYLYQQIVPEKGKVFAEIKKVNLIKLPIRTINFDDPNDKALHDQMVSLVDQMLNLHEQIAAAKNPQQKTTIQRQINATDAHIDQLVYQLYELTEEEIRLIEF